MAAEAGKHTYGIARALAVAVGYGALAFFSLSITRFGAQVESIWISNALLVWALVAAPVRAWPLLMLAGAAGHLGAHLLVGDRVDFTLALLVADIAECALAAYLLRRRPRALAFENRGSTFYFLFVCGVVAPLASAGIALAATGLLGEPLSPREFIVWFSVDALGLIVFLPIINAIAQGHWRSLRGKMGRTALALALIVVVATISVTANMPLLRLLLLPVFVIVAFELGVAGVQLALGVAMLAWTTLVYLGNAPRLFGDVDMRDSLLLVQVLTAIFTASFLPLAVVIEEKQRLNDALAETLEETREAWGAIIGAEARYRLVVDNVSETVMRVKQGGEILFASPACAQLLGATAPFEGRNLVAMLHPEDESWVLERVRTSVAQGLFNMPQRWRVRIRGDDDAWHSIDARVTPVLLDKRGAHEFIVVLRPEHDVNPPA